MKLTEKQVLNYWSYAEMLNEELGNTKRFVEPTKDNYNTYSMEYTKIILSACSEIEVVCRLICEIIDDSKDYTSKNNSIKMHGLSKTLFGRFPNIYKAKQNIPFQHEAVCPFKEWKNSLQRLSWWDAYNNIKHARYNCFSQSTLINALNSVAALIILNSYLYKLVTGNHAPSTSRVGMFDNCYSYQGISVLPTEELPDL